MKKGVNFEESDLNYDLFELVLEIIVEWLFFNFLFLDVLFNVVYYDGRLESEVCYMGCCICVMFNIYGEEIVIGRGNLLFMFINLVKLVLISGLKEVFFEVLNYYLDLGIK